MDVEQAFNGREVKYFLQNVFIFAIADFIFLDIVQLENLLSQSGSISQFLQVWYSSCHINFQIVIFQAKLEEIYNRTSVLKALECASSEIRR